MRCANCGHHRASHRRPSRLSGWERSRGQTGPRPDAWFPCHQVMSNPDGRVRYRLVRCKCRNFKEEVTK